MDPEKTPDSPLTPDNRRRFMKRSFAAGIVASQPTLLTGLIRAQGGGGSGDTTTTEHTTASTGVTTETTGATTTTEDTTIPQEHDIFRTDLWCPAGTALSFDANGYAQSGPSGTFFPIIDLSCQSGWSGFYKLKAVRSPATLNPHPTQVSVNIEVEFWINAGGVNHSRQSHEFEILCDCDPGNGNINEVNTFVPIPAAQRQFTWQEVCNGIPVDCMVEAELGPVKVSGGGSSLITVTGDVGINLYKNSANTGVNPKKTFKLEVESHPHP